MAAEFSNFADLSRTAPRGEFFETKLKKRASDWSAIAIHGGKIEPVTEYIAVKTAAKDLSYYYLKAIKDAPAGRTLHLTSTKFDDPDALEIVGSSNCCLAIHGRKDRDDDADVWVGGLDAKHRELMVSEFKREGFPARVELKEHPGTHKSNICNKAKSGAGVQLEIPLALRKELRADERKMIKFVRACRSMMKL